MISVAIISLREDIIYEGAIYILNRDIGKFGGHPELSMTGSDLVLEWCSFCHRSGAHTEPNGAALHINDGSMMSVLPRRCGSKTNDILGLYLPHHLFESESGYVVTFIDDHLAVFGDKVFHLIFEV